MNAIANLVKEHRRIEQMLSSLERLGLRLEAGDAVPEWAVELVAFFELFADQQHHAKEEAQLFPVLAAHGITPEHGLVEALKHQHEMGRVHTRALRELLHRIAGGDRAAAAAFVVSAHSYAELLRVHIQIEDDDLYPEAERTLTAGEQAALAAAFDAADSTRAAIDQHERWDRLAAACRSLTVHG